MKKELELEVEVLLFRAESRIKRLRAFLEDGNKELALKEIDVIEKCLRDVRTSVMGK